MRIAIKCCSLVSSVKYYLQNWAEVSSRWMRTNLNLIRVEHQNAITVIVRVTRRTCPMVSFMLHFLTRWICNVGKLVCFICRVPFKVTLFFAFWGFDDLDLRRADVINYFCYRLINVGKFWVRFIDIAWFRVAADREAANCLIRDENDWKRGLGISSIGSFWGGRPTVNNVRNVW